MNPFPIACIGFIFGIAALALGAEPVADVSWLADVQRPPARPADDAPRLPPLVVDSRDSSVAGAEHGRQLQQQLLDRWKTFLTLLDRPDHAPPLQIIQKDTTDGVVRQLVRYESEPGWVTEAYLLKPQRMESPARAVVVFHSTVPHSIRQPAGVEGDPSKAFGLRLAQRGLVVFCPRNFLWPTNHAIDTERQMQAFRQLHPDSRGMAKMLLDAMVAVDIVQAMPEVDRARIGAVGHSLGAKEVLYLAAFDPRVKVVVSSEGGIGRRFSNWDAEWYLGSPTGPEMPQREHHELLALIAPRPFLLVGGNSADGDRSWPFVEAAMPVYKLFTSVPRLGLLNHREGHSVPPLAVRRIDEWILTYL